MSTSKKRHVENAKESKKKNVEESSSEESSDEEEYTGNEVISFLFFINIRESNCQELTRLGYVVGSFKNRSTQQRPGYNTQLCHNFTYL